MEIKTRDSIDEGLTQDFSGRISVGGRTTYPHSPIRPGNGLGIPLLKGVAWSAKKKRRNPDVHLKLCYSLFKAADPFNLYYL